MAGKFTNFLQKYKILNVKQKWQANGWLVKTGIKKF